MNLLCNFLNILPRDRADGFRNHLRIAGYNPIYDIDEGRYVGVSGLPFGVDPAIEKLMRENNEAAYQSAKAKMPADLTITVSGEVATGKSAILGFILGALREKGFDVRAENDEADGALSDIEGPKPSIRLREEVALAFEPCPPLVKAMQPVPVSTLKLRTTAESEPYPHPVLDEAAFLGEKRYTKDDVRAAALRVKNKYGIAGKPLIDIARKAIGRHISNYSNLLPYEYAKVIEALEAYDPNKVINESFAAVVDPDDIEAVHNHQEFSAPGYPDGNPKTAVGAAKLPLDLVPPIAMQHLAAAFKDGEAKYNPFNWREQQVSSTVYYAAAMRHLFAWFDGEDFADDSGVHHLAHAMACMAIVLDAESVGMLNDNRPTAGKAADMQKEFTA